LSGGTYSPSFVEVDISPSQIEGKQNPSMFEVDISPSMFEVDTSPSLVEGVSSYLMVKGSTSHLLVRGNASESLRQHDQNLARVQQAQEFIEKLDQRFANLRSTLENEVTMGRDTPPKNLLEASRLASKWKVKYTTPNGNNVTTFATSAFTHKPNGGEKGKNNRKKGTRDEKGKSKNGKEKNESESEEPWRPCFLCGDTHFMKDCPIKDLAVEQAKQIKAHSNTASNRTNSAASSTLTTTTNAPHELRHSPFNQFSSPYCIHTENHRYD